MNSKLIKLLEEGFALQQAGELANAEQRYQTVLKKDPKNEFALNLMGVLCLRQSRADEAVSFLTAALKSNNTDADTHSNLGLAFKELNRFDEAKAAFEKSLSLEPKRPATLNNLGNVLAATDQHEAAIKRFQSALSLDNGYVDCMNNFAVSLKELGRVEQGLQVIEHAIRTDENNSRSFNIAGELFLAATQWEQAREAFGRSIAIDNNVVARMNVSTALKQLGEPNAATAHLEHVLKIEENNSEAHNRLGVLCEQLGETKKAARHFRLAIKHTPSHASSYYQLAKLKDQRLSDEEIKKIRSLLDDPATLDIFRSSLFFALACEANKDDAHDESFQYLLSAQAIKASRHPYDGEATRQYVQAAKQVFPLRVLPGSRQADISTVPIFVVGMPRSGTTLTEQIVSTHSAIEGAGELGLMNEIVKEVGVMTNQPFPKSVESLSDQQAHSLKEMYLDKLVKRFGRHPFIVDKNPLNFHLIGLIATLFPEAKILYCKRNPIDNCVSIFRLPFDDNQGYSHELTALGHYYRQHDELMEYWLSCYPNQILTVQYEDTVGDLEQQARRLLEFIGVEFEEQVMKFFDNDRVVMTPSASQVRQPIYKDSIASWKKYEKHLGPLLESLGETNAGQTSGG